jgi:hypothetical protein
MVSTPEPFIDLGLGISAVESRTTPTRRPAAATMVVVVSDSTQFQHLAGRQVQRCRRDGQVLSTLVLQAEFDTEPDALRRQQLLSECTRRVCSRVRSTDCVARWQDSHFGVMLPQCDAANTQLVLARLMHVASGNYRLGNQLLTLRLQGQVLGLAGPG